MRSAGATGCRSIDMRFERMGDGAAPAVNSKSLSHPAAFCVSRSRPHPDLRDEADPPGLCRTATGPNRRWAGSYSAEEPASYSPQLARGPGSRSPVPQPPPRPMIIASFHNPSARRPRMIAAGPRCGDAHPHPAQVDPPRWGTCRKLTKTYCIFAASGLFRGRAYPFP